MDNPDLWRTTADWLLDLDQTHSAFPALCYFPDSSPDQSWIASVGTVLDGAALLMSGREYNTEEHASEEIKGPMMVLAYGIPGLVRIGQSVGLPLDTPERFLGLLARASEPPPAMSRLTPWRTRIRCTEMSAT